MVYKQLGEMLISAGYISEEELKKALESQKGENRGKKLGDILVSMGFTTQRRINEVLERQLGCKFVDLRTIVIPKELARILPRSIAKKHNIVPVKEEDDTLYIAIADPLNFIAIDETRMRKGALSVREYILVGVLVLLLLGVCYYLFYYTPLQDDIQSINVEKDQVVMQITEATRKYESMSTMQAELDEIFGDGKKKVTEIAPYDNAKVVMTELNGILGQSQNYRLSFSDPLIGADGTVRRNVSMSFPATAMTLQNGSSRICATASGGA